MDISSGTNPERVGGRPGQPEENAAPTRQRKIIHIDMEGYLGDEQAKDESSEHA